MLRYLNIEVASGIVAIALLAARLLHVELAWSWYLVVPVVTWAVYTLDRLLDTRNPATAPATGRHTFHALHRRPLYIAVATALVVAAVVAVIDFPLDYWLAALPLAALTLLHLALQRTRSRTAAIIKDLNVTVTFTVSAWIIPFIVRIQADETIDYRLSAATFIAVLLLVLIDVLLLSELDAKNDMEDQRPSIAVALGPSGVRLTLAFLRATVAAIAIVVVMDADVAAALLLLAMTGAYSFLARRNFKNTDTARISIEAVLTLPLILLLLPK